MGSTLGALIGLFFLVLMAWLIATSVRRVLGVPVGWFRSLVVALMMVLSTQVVLEMVLPTGTLPNPLLWMAGMRKTWPRNRRYRQVVATFIRHGLGANLRGFGRRGESGARDERSWDSTATALRRALEDFGITFVKLGQNLSARSDLLPASFVRELSRLQSDVAAGVTDQNITVPTVHAEFSSTRPLAMDFPPGTSVGRAQPQLQALSPAVPAGSPRISPTPSCARSWTTASSTPICTPATSCCWARGRARWG